LTLSLLARCGFRVSGEVYGQYRSFRSSEALYTDRVFWDRQRWRVFLPACQPVFV